MSVDNVKLCYSYSARVDTLGFIDLLHSLHIAKQWFKKEDIIVFFTPPFNNDHEQQIAKYATVIKKKDHYPIPHQIFDPNDPTPPFYWDKYYFTEIDSDNLIFLDNDTELQRDIRTYFDPHALQNRKTEIVNRTTVAHIQDVLRAIDVNYDVLVFGDDHRCDAHYLDVWGKTCTYLNTTMKPVLMTTAILFKNRTHQKIKSELASIANKYMVDKSLEFPAEDRLFDEYVFSLAVRNYNVQTLPKNVDMLWTLTTAENARTHAAILHGGGRKLFSIDVVPTQDKVFSKELLIRIKNDGSLKHWIERVNATFITMMEDKHPGFGIRFGLEGNTVVMHTNAALTTNVIERTMSYVWADKPAEFEFVVRGDLK